GRLHVGGFSTGPTAFAVNIAGAVPFAVKGYAEGFQGYNLIVIVKKDSPYQKLTDLKGKKLAHTAPSSNSGHMAPVALFPK
ncbi:PhnD/SsuA/transferrin family substrate-binding protein, partial [Campylobacter lari]